MPYEKNKTYLASIVSIIGNRHAQLVKIFAAIAAPLLLLCGPQFAMADSPAEPHSYTTLSENKEFEFVMNAPGDKSGRDRRRSGLYRRDGSSNPLWTVNWYAGSVIVASDGVHLVRSGPWAGSLGDEAFSFFESGKLIRSYQIKDLLTTSEGLVYTSSHFFWLKNLNFDDAKGWLSLTTLTGDQKVFDIAKGEIIQSGKTADRLLNAEKIAAFDLRTKTVRLDHPEEIIGLTLPAGTEVKMAGRIESAVLHERVSYRGISMDSGTTLYLANRHLYRKSRGDEVGLEALKDRYANMMVVGVSQPSEWQIGPLRIRGVVGFLEDGDALTVKCYGSTCHYGESKVIQAVFRSGLRLKSFAMQEGESFKVLVGTDLLHSKYGAEFWSTGNLRRLTLDKAQKFQGKTVIGDLRFWSNGKLQEADTVNSGSRLFCKNGEPRKAFGAAQAGSLGYLEQCDDGSIVYVKYELLCGGRSDWVRTQLPFLLERPPGRFKECDEPTIYALAGGGHKVIFKDIEW